MDSRTKDASPNQRSQAHPRKGTSPQRFGQGIRYPRPAYPLQPPVPHGDAYNATNRARKTKRKFWGKAKWGKPKNQSDPQRKHSGAGGTKPAYGAVPIRFNWRRFVPRTLLQGNWKIWRWFKFASILICAMVVAFIAVVLYVGARTAVNLNTSVLMDIDRERRVAAIYDNRGFLVGKLSSGLEVPPPYTTVTVGEVVPEHFWNFVVAREDRRFGTWSWFGVDLSPSTWYRTLTLQSGGSTTPMMLARNMLGWADIQARLSPRNDAIDSAGQWSIPIVRKLFVFTRKVSEYGAAVAIAGAYRGTGDYAPFKRLFADHVPLATGNGTIYGVFQAAEALFGKRPAQLSIAEQAILAACVWRPAPTRLATTDSERLSDRWDAIIDRASSMVRLTLRQGSREAKAALSELDEFRERKPIRDPSRFGFGYDARVSLDARREQLVSSEAGLALQEGQADGRAGLRAVRLTVDASAGRAFKMRARTLLDELGHSVGTSLLECPPAHAQSTCEDDPGRARVALIAANDAGAIERLYLTSAQTFDQRFPLGSVSKIVAALHFAQQGDTAEKVYCRLQVDGLKDADGYSGAQHCSGIAAVTAAQAFAMSSNLAIFERLRTVSESALQETLDQLGFLLPRGQSARYAVAFGTVEGSPRAVASLVHALQCSIQGCRGGAGIHAVADVAGSFGQREQPRVQANSARPVVNAQASTHASRAYLSTVLGEVVRSGTLAGLRLPHPSHFGKTGTAVSPSGGVRAKWIVGGVGRQDGSRGIYVAMLASPNARPLAASLPTRRVLPLVRLLVG